MAWGAMSIARTIEWYALALSNQLSTHAAVAPPWRAGDGQLVDPMAGGHGDGGLDAAGARGVFEPSA